MLDKDDEKLYAYALTGGSRDSGLDIDLDDNGENYNSIWSDGTTMYVVENTGGSASRHPQIHKLPLPASVLVSNAGQTAGANTGADTERAQTFRTGDNYHGYTLESVKLFTGNSVSVDLAVWTTDANGHPDALHATLTPPASFAAGEIEFTDPADSRLERNTTYALRISSPTSARLQLPITASSAEGRQQQERLEHWRRLSPAEFDNQRLGAIRHWLGLPRHDQGHAQPRYRPRRHHRPARLGA